MAYSVDENTKIATLDGVEYYPAAVYDGRTKQYTMVALTEEECQEKKSDADAWPAQQLETLRQERNRKIAETDHWALSDTATMTQAQRDYRQALRDITNSYTNLEDVVWPTKP